MAVASSTTSGRATLAIVVLWAVASWQPGRHCALVAAVSRSELPVPVTDPVQKQALHQTLKALLNFKRSPHPLQTASDDTRRTSRSTVAASKYMQRLFVQQMMLNGKDPSSSSSSASTIVRSIIPVSGYFESWTATVFNLSAIQPDEQVLRAEIHCHIGSKKQKQQKLGRSLKCYQTLPSLAVRKDLTVVSSDSSNGWVTFDVRNAVQAATLFTASSQPALARQLRIVCVKSPSSVGTVRSYRARTTRLCPYDAVFLIVRSRAGDGEHRLKSAAALLDRRDPDPDPDSDPEPSRGGRRQRRSDDHYFRYFYEVPTADNASTTASLTGAVLNEMKSFQARGPAVLHPYRYRKRNNGRRNNRLPERSASDRALDRNNYPPFGTMRRGGQRATNGLSSRLPYYDVASTEATASTDHQQETLVLLPGVSGGLNLDRRPCQKYDIVVDFRDIGWGEWIIAPKTFETNYCAGSCAFPMNDAMNPSNHAIIQSIMHAIGLEPIVPQVCCAPSKMDSLTLLYFDEDQNVVLKTYPRMVVTSCGCV